MTKMRGNKDGQGGGVIDYKARMVRLFRYIKNKKVYVSNVTIPMESGIPSEISVSHRLKDSSLMSQALAERVLAHVKASKGFQMELFFN